MLYLKRVTASTNYANIFRYISFFFTNAECKTFGVSHDDQSLEAFCTLVIIACIQHGGYACYCCTRVHRQTAREIKNYRNVRNIRVWFLERIRYVNGFDYARPLFFFLILDKTAPKIIMARGTWKRFYV